MGSERRTPNVVHNISHFPDDWESLPLGQLVDESRGICYGIVQPGIEDPSGVPIVRVNNIRNGHISSADILRVVHGIEAQYQRSRLRGGEVLLTLVGSLGQTAITNHSHKGWNVARAVGVIPVRSEVGPRWVELCLRSEPVQHLIRTWATTTVQATLNLRDVAQLPIPMPPRAKREAIANILGTLDDKIELNRRMNETLEGMARAIFKSWFVDFDPVRAKAEGRQPAGMDAATAALFPDSFEDSPLGKIPKGWVQSTIGEDTDFFTGFAFKSNLFRTELPGVRLARGDNVKEGVFHWDDKSRYWPAITPDLERYSLQKGDSLIGMDGSKVGKNWVRVRQSDLPCLLVQRVARLRPKNVVGENFIWVLISDPRFLEYVDAVKTGTSIPHISGGQIQKYPFLRPPRGDNRLFQQFELLVSPLTVKGDICDQENRLLASIRDSLLPKLLSGELRVHKAEVIVQDRVRA